MQPEHQPRWSAGARSAMGKREWHRTSLQPGQAGYWEYSDMLVCKSELTVGEGRSVLHSSQCEQGAA